MREPFFTIGHSNREIAEFLGLLRESQITMVVDVRRLPGSNRYPQFNADALAAVLDAAGIGFRRAAGLTGRRPVSKDVPFEVNAWWQNRSFHNYADHALSDEFAEALASLRDDADRGRTAIMCAEAVWWRCHRRIIADHLLAHGETVAHIVGVGHTDAAELSAGAVVGQAGGVTYPAPVR
ncbi:DUF488 family protein [Gordonia phthalatica]|uniref:DNA repair protein n=1 Tax=Gordonia phthalatica TaxID=1136941 RepID=A0A0N9NEM4_9ACTN|nr:DUF488 domain-containing protein [Gordonia phthalatica]ALG86170.1 hypothetical protein ACH46_18810 [Gordonia phthalatica]